MSGPLPRHQVVSELVLLWVSEVYATGENPLGGGVLKCTAMLTNADAGPEVRVHPERHRVGSDHARSAVEGLLQSYGVTHDFEQDGRSYRRSLSLEV